MLVGYSQEYSLIRIYFIEYQLEFTTRMQYFNCIFEWRRGRIFLFQILCRCTFGPITFSKHLFTLWPLIVGAAPSRIYAGVHYLIMGILLPSKPSRHGAFTPQGDRCGTAFLPMQIPCRGTFNPLCFQDTLSSLLLCHFPGTVVSVALTMQRLFHAMEYLLHRGIDRGSAQTFVHSHRPHVPSCVCPLMNSFCPACTYSCACIYIHLSGRSNELIPVCTNNHSNVGTLAFMPIHPLLHLTHAFIPLLAQARSFALAFLLAFAFSTQAHSGAW